MVAGMLLICFASYSLFFWDVFPEKHQLLLGINKIDHVCCSSVQRGKENLKDVSQGTALAQSVKLK